MSCPRLRFSLVLLFTSAAIAQQYVITTVAGGNAPPAPAPSSGGSIGADGAITVDSSGNVYFAASYCIWKISPAGVPKIIAGTGRPGFGGDGGPATAGNIEPTALSVDGQGNVVFADGNRLRKISPSGVLTTLAGNGLYPYSVANGPAVSTPINSQAVAFDPQGNLIFADGSNIIRKISPDGMVVTIAGTGKAGFAGDGGPAINASFQHPTAIAIDAQGNIFIVDSGNNRIRKISADGTITTVAGNGTPGFAGDGGQATGARLNFPQSVAVGPAGDLYIADSSNARVRKVAPDGTISTFAGKGAAAAYSGEGGQAVNATLSPSAVAVDLHGTLYISDETDYRILAVSPDGIITTFAGNGSPSGLSGSAKQATGALLDYTLDVAADAQGNLFLPDRADRIVRKVAPDGSNRRGWEHGWR